METQQIQIGQKVVCINDRFPAIFFEFAFQIPKKGQVYTVIRKGACIDAVTQSNVLGLHFFELHNPVFWERGEPWFSAWRFRVWADEMENTECLEIKEPQNNRDWSRVGKQLV